MKKVFIIGGVSYDTILYMDSFPKPEPQTLYSNHYNETIGSTGSGKALALNKLGLNVSLHAVAGDDYFGNKINKTLTDEGINYFYDIDPNGTERHTNIMDKSGRRISIYLNTSSFEPNVDIDKIEDNIKNSDYIVLNIINYCRYLIPIIKKYNKEIWCDLNDYDGENPYHQDFIDAADYIFMSSDNLRDYKNIMKKFIEQGKNLVICTHGKEGATALTGDLRWIEVPIISEYKLKDSNGAGDNFFSGFLYGYIKGYNINECLKLASIAGGLCISSKELVNDNLSEKKLEEEYNNYFL